MSENKLFLRHTVTLSALFVLGDAIIILPVKNADNFTFLAFLLSFFLLLSVSFLAGLSVPVLVNTTVNSSRLKKGITVCVCVLLSLFALFCAADTFSETVSFISQVILPNTNKFFIILLYGFTATYFALKRQENIFKFSLIAFAVTATVILFFFFALMGKYEWHNIFIYKLPAFSEIFSQTKPYIINPVLPIVLLPFYFGFALKHRNLKAQITGVFMGAALLGLAVLISVLLFTSDLAGRLDYPFSSAISTVSVGRLFTRLDGFSYFVYFICSLLKISVCTFVIYKSLEKINLITKRTE